MAVPEGGAQGLETSDMSGQLEDSEDSENSEDLCSLGNVLDGVLGREKVKDDRDKEWEDSKKVNYIEE